MTKRKSRTPRPAGGGRGADGREAPRKEAAKAAKKTRSAAKPLPPWMPETTAAPARRSAARGAGPSSAPSPARRGAAQGRPARGAPPPSTFQDPFAAREAERYADPIPSREAILQLLEASEGPLSAGALAEQLDLTAPERFEALGKRLAAMLRDGQLVQNRRGGYAPVEQTDLIPGVVIANPNGFGFLRPDAGGDDLFLPPYEMRKVMHGDRVLANLTGMDRMGRREGSISRVLERGLTRLVGRYVVDAGISFVEPDDKRLQRNVHIPPDARGEARDGQLVVCELTQPPDARRPPIGRILVVLGEKLTPSLVVETAIHGHELPHEFPQAVLDEAAGVPLEVDAAQALASADSPLSRKPRASRRAAPPSSGPSGPLLPPAGEGKPLHGEGKQLQLPARVDLRALPLVTIDGEDAKDFDDAVYCEPVRDGFRLVVAIADVSHYVRPGTPLDEEAQRRATSVYFPGFVVPMLPETLSNGICSLNPRVDRLCFVCDMQVDRDGEVRRSRFYEAVMNSHARLTYTQVWRAVGERDEQARRQIGVLLPQVEQLHQLYRVLAKARSRRGAIEFESSEVRFVLDNRGEVVQAGMIQRNDAHKLIEECMIAANVEAAKFLLGQRMQAPFRIHERPPEQKYADLLEFLKEFKLRMPAWSQVEPGDFTRLLKKVRERADAALIESVLLRSQSMAVYSPDNVGHFGLALEAYAHFTSPIRRYPDLMVHRAIKHVLAGGGPRDFLYAPREVAGLALQCSERERRADEAEREVDERYRAAWMEQHVGSEFDGVISGVTGFGLFVELDESKVSGLVHVTQLPHDYYRFDAVRKTLTGERRGDEYRLGDRVRIIVLKASLEERRIDFRLVADRGGAGRAPAAGAASPAGRSGRAAQAAPKPPPPRGLPAKRPKKKY